MKTLTELSGSLVRMAAAAIEDARRSLPAKDEPAPPPPEDGAEAAAPVGTAEAAGSPDAEPAATPASSPSEAADDAASSAVLDEAVAQATGLSRERAALLRDAVEAVGGRAADVRLVRVFGVEESVSGATTLRGHQFVVDLFPREMRQVAGSPGEERGRGRGGRRGGGGERGGKGGPASGGFSMDAVRQDRKNEPGGRGRGGGMRSAGAGRSTPKK